MHARTPKNFVLEERLERFGKVIEVQPRKWAGRWADACLPSIGAAGEPRAFDEVRLDLGCGKGAFIVASARQNPSILYIGIDAEPLCVAYTAQHIVEAGLKNAVVVPALGSSVAELFSHDELDCIHLNFPTPYPRKKEASRRLVILERLLEYRTVLKPGACVQLRTDSQPLRDFALTQFELAGYKVLRCSNDERAELPNEPTSEYEERLTAQGAPVFGVWATPGEAPQHPRQTARLSLVDYLPTDLFANGYVPHGMQGTVINLRNRAIRNSYRQA